MSWRMTFSSMPNHKAKPTRVCIVIQRRCLLLLCDASGARRANWRRQRCTFPRFRIKMMVFIRSHTLVGVQVSFAIREEPEIKYTAADLCRFSLRGGLVSHYIFAFAGRGYIKYSCGIIDKVRKRERCKSDESRRIKSCYSRHTKRYLEEGHHIIAFKSATQLWQGSVRSSVAQFQPAMHFCQSSYHAASLLLHAETRVSDTFKRRKQGVYVA